MHVAVDTEGWRLLFLSSAVKHFDVRAALMQQQSCCLAQWII